MLADGHGLVLAGATDLLARGDAPLTGRSVVDVTRVAGLRGVVISAHTVRIGASTTWGALERAELPPELWGLREAAGRVGHEVGQPSRRRLHRVVERFDEVAGQAAGYRQDQSVHRRDE